MKTLWNRLGILALAVAVVAAGCAAPTPVVQQVEVTRMVESTSIVHDVVTATPPPAVEEKPFRIALIMPSSINDKEWSQSIYEGLLAVQKKMGGAGKLEIAVSEDTWQIPDAAAAARDYASQGYDLVITHGAQYGTSLAQLAVEFPQTSFAWGTTTNTFQADGINNIFAYEPEAAQGGYVNGVMAAMLTESGTIGVTGPIEAGDARLYNAGFKAGALATKPDLKVNISYTGSFSGVSLMSAAAETHIASGADVLSGTSQSVTGAVSVCKDKGVYWFAAALEQFDLAPDIVAANLIYRWDGLIVDMIESHQAGVMGGKVYFLTFKNGGLEMKYNDKIITPEIKAAAEAAIKGIEDGTITLAP